MKKNRVLFILKKRHKGPYGSWNYTNGENLDSGLYISARQVVMMLQANGVKAALDQAIDNNCIDRLVTKHKPTHVIIEAFWVVPEKFDVLKKLHPGVTWIVRCHSKIDFLSHEGAVIGWVFDYLKRGVQVGCNSLEAQTDFQELAKVFKLNDKLITYLPNFYNTRVVERNVWKKIIELWKKYKDIFRRVKPVLKTEGELNVGCFGAIRPLKNHMAQAVAAMLLADKLKLKLKFHISATRIEGQAGGIVKALRALFAQSSKHKLIEHEWMPHDVFLTKLKTIDIVTQVSLSETFNIVAADSVSVGTPVVGSEQIPWLAKEYTVPKPVDVQSNLTVLTDVWTASGTNILVADQLDNLNKYCEGSKKVWLRSF